MILDLFLYFYKDNEFKARAEPSFHNIPKDRLLSMDMGTAFIHMVLMQV